LSLCVERNGKSDDVRELSGFINCLSLSEKKTAQLYASMAGKIDLPLVKSLMLEISLDSQKHYSAQRRGGHNAKS